MNRLLSLGLSVSQEALKKQAPAKPGPKPQQPSPKGAYLPPLTPRVERPRRFVLPGRYEAKYRYPLIVWLHSDGDNENQISRVLPYISTQNYVGVGIRGSRSIDAAGHRFDWTFGSAAVARCEDAVFQAIEAAKTRYSIHPDRVFLAGYGAGGTMARRVSLRQGSAFAGCLSLGGRFPNSGGMFSNLSASRSVKHFWAVATAGNEISDDEFAADIQRVAAARLSMDVRRYTVDDEMMREVLQDADRWIMGQVSGTATTYDNWSSSPVGFSEN